MSNPQDFSLKRTYSGAPVLEGPPGERLDLDQYRKRLQELVEEENRAVYAGREPTPLPGEPAPAETPDAAPQEVTEEQVERVRPVLGAGVDQLIRTSGAVAPGAAGLPGITAQALAPQRPRVDPAAAPVLPAEEPAPAFRHVPTQAGDFTPTLRTETTFSGPSFRWKAAKAPISEERRREHTMWRRYKELQEAANDGAITPSGRQEYGALQNYFAQRIQEGRTAQLESDSEVELLNPLGQVQEGTMVGVVRAAPGGDQQRGFRPAQGYVWEDPNDLRNLRVRRQTARDAQTRVQFQEPDPERATPEALNRLMSLDPPEGWSLDPAEVDTLVATGALDDRFRNNTRRVWNVYRAQQLKKVNQTNAEAALTSHALRLRDPETLAITTALLEEGLPLADIGTDAPTINQTEMLERLIYKYSITEEEKLNEDGLSVTDLGAEDFAAFQRNVEQKAVETMGHLLALTRFAATDSFDPNVTDRIMERNIALRHIYSAAAPPAWYPASVEGQAGELTSPAEAAQIMGDLRAIPRQIDMYTGLSKWGRVLGFTSTAMAGILEAPDATELFDIDFDGGFPSLYTSYGSRAAVDATRRGADPFDHLTDWGQMFLGVTDDPGTLEHLVGTGALLLYTFFEPEPITPLLATASLAAKGARLYAIPARMRKADRLLQDIVRLQDRGEDVADLMNQLEKADPGMAALVGSAAQQGLGLRGTGSNAFRQLNQLIQTEKEALDTLRANAAKRAEEAVEAMPAAVAAEAELELIERELRLARLLEAAAAARKNSALHTAGLSLDEAATVTTPKKLDAKRTVLDNAETVFRRRVTNKKKELTAFGDTGRAAEQRVVDARTAYDEVLSENVPAVAPAAARTARGRVRADWYPLTEAGDDGRTIGVAELTVQKKDIVAEMVVTGTRRGSAVIEPQPTSMGAVGKLEGCVVNDILIGTRTRTPGKVGRIPRSGRARQIEVYLEVTEPTTGRVYMVRHPISNLSPAEGGLSMQQARNINRAKTARLNAIRANADDVLRYHKLQKELATETANLKAMRTREPLLRPIEHFQKAARARIRLEKALKARAKEIGKAKGDVKKYNARVNKLTNTLAKEARTLQSEAELRASTDIFRTTVEKVQKGIQHERKLFETALGNPVKAAFTKSMAEILNYDKLLPQQLQDSVVRISGKALSGVTKEGEGTVNLHKLFSELGAETKRPGAKAEDLLVDSDSVLLPRALEKLKGGDSTMALGPGEVGKMQAELENAIRASHKFESRLRDNAAVYAGIWKSNADYHAIAQRTMLGRLRRTLWGVASGKDPVVFARMLKRAQVGAASDEMLDSAIAADRILDLGLQELVALSNGGSMPEAEMIPKLVAFFDKSVGDKKLIFGADRFGGGQEELFLEVIGGSTRYQSGKAHILDDIRTDPLHTAIDQARADKLRERLRALVANPLIKAELGADAAEEISDSVLSTLMRVTNDVDAGRGDMARPLAIISRAFYGSGAKGTDAAPELTAAAYRILKTSDTFEEFTSKMARVTAAITNHSPSGGFSKKTGEYFGGKAYAKVASAFTLAGTQAWMARQINKALFAPLTTEQAVAINRIFTGAVPKLDAAPAKATTAERLASGALSEKELDDAFRALADMGMPQKEVAIAEEIVGSSRAINEKAKLLRRMADDGTGMNAFVPRKLMDDLGKDLDRMINKLIPETPVALDPASMAAQAVNGMGSAFTQLSSIWRTSVTTGLLMPNFGYWGNMHMGDISQMIFGEGWRTGLKVSFNNSLAYLPYVGRGLNDRALLAASRVDGEVLPTLMEAMFNPWLGKLFAGQDFVVPGRSGIQFSSSQLKQMLVEDGIMGTYVNQELVDLFGRALDNTPNGKWLRKWRGRNYEIANHANMLQQRQRAGLYLELVINKGVPRQEAARRTLEALYDWKHGLTRLEATISTSYIPFLRFWALAMRQMAGAAVEPLTKSVGRSFLDAATGRTKIARLGQQIRVFGGVPEMLGLDNEEAMELESFYASILPTYMDTRSMLGYGGLPADSAIRDWYLRETGRDFDGILWMLPTVTMFDTATMYRGAITSLYAAAGALNLHDGEIPAHWEADILEPILNTTAPAVQTMLRGALSQMPGVNLDYYSRSGYRNLSYQEEMVLSPGKHLPFIPDSWNFPMKRDPETGRMSMGLWTYTAAGMFPGLLTQVPRWVKALNNPAMEEGYLEYIKWVAGSFSRYGSPTPYFGRAVADMEIRRVNTGFSDEMRGVGEIYSGERIIDDD